jgi:lysozyme
MTLNVKVVSVLILTLLTPKFFQTGSETNKSGVLNLISDIQRSETRYVSEYQFEKGYEEAIMFIKDHEGYNAGYSYIDVSGIHTIGYGHVLTEGETFNEPISQKEAEELLRRDFDKAVRAVERETELEGYQKIAIAHFVFAKGIGTFLKSSLKKRIEQNEPIDDELDRWCYYRSAKTGKLVRSEHSANIREWEAEMFGRTSNLTGSL